MQVNVRNGDTVERRKGRKQFCAFSARARFITAWVKSRPQQPNVQGPLFPQQRTFSMNRLKCKSRSNNPSLKRPIGLAASDIGPCPKSAKRRHARASAPNSARASLGVRSGDALHLGVAAQ